MLIVLKFSLFVFLVLSGIVRFIVKDIVVLSHTRYLGIPLLILSTKKLIRLLLQVIFLEVNCRLGHFIVSKLRPLVNYHIPVHFIEILSELSINLKQISKRFK